jgi:hypothetical protein
MAPKTEPSVSELEAEHSSIQTKLFPLYAAQEAANIDLRNAEAAQRSASGPALTEAVIASQKYKAEVIKYTEQIVPLKSRGEVLRRDIETRKRVEQVARLRAIGADQVEPAAHAVAKHAAALIEAVRQYCDAQAALVAACNPDEGRGIRNEMDLGGIADFVWLRLSEAGLPMRKPLGSGVSPTDSAAQVVSLLETLR